MWALAVVGSRKKSVLKGLARMGQMAAGCALFDTSFVGYKNLTADWRAEVEVSRVD